MAETIQMEPMRSGELIQTGKVESPPEAAKTAESSKTEKTWQSSEQTVKTQMTALQETLAECARLLKRTSRVWLIPAGVTFGLIAVVTLMERVSERARNARERRQEEAVASVTPDRLIARCGQPAEDVTQEVYPILMRTMRYQSKGIEKLVLVFSRTAEVKSDWVFLTMKDESRAKSYEYNTPEAKIAALPCLDSRR